MSYELERKKWGRNPLQMVELHLDYCGNVFGDSACGARGNQCYNTFFTCRSQSNFLKREKVYKFATANSKLPNGENIFPRLVSVDVVPAEIQSKGLAARGMVSIYFDDFPHHDRGTDPYWKERQGSKEGTFFGRLIARNPYVKGRKIVIKQGFIDDDGAFQYRPHTYFIDRIEPPNSRGRVKIVAEDILSATSNKKAKAPLESTGKLSELLEIDATELEVDDTASYPVGGGEVVIGGEVIKYTSISGKKLTGLTRGTNRPAEEHDEGDSVQLVLTYKNKNVKEVIEDLVIFYGGVDPQYIDSQGWENERVTWLNDIKLSGSIVKPTGLQNILAEITEQIGVYLWWDDESAKLRMKAIAPALPTESVAYVDDTNILENSIKVESLEKERLSEVVMNYIMRDVAEGDEDNNFKKKVISLNPDAEHEFQYGEKKNKTFNSRFIQSDAVADSLTQRVLERFKDAPLQITFKLDASQADIKTGDHLLISTRLVQNINGEAEARRYIVMKSKLLKDGVWEYKALEFKDASNGDFGLFAENIILSYSDESDENRQKYAFYADDEGLNSDGSEGIKYV